MFAGYERVCQRFIMAVMRLPAKSICTTIFCYGGRIDDGLCANGPLVMCPDSSDTCAKKISAGFFHLARIEWGQYVYVQEAKKQVSFEILAVANFCLNYSRTTFLVS